VWTSFPEREAPSRPGPPHVAYTLAVFRRPGAPPSFAALLAYTTSTGLVFDDPQPLGLWRFSEAEARALGQERAFRLDLKVLAAVPISPRWFPRLGAPGDAVLGRAPKRLRDAIAAELAKLLRQRPEAVERRGPS